MHGVGECTTALYQSEIYCVTNRYMQTLQFYFHATMLVLIYAYCFLTRMILATLHNMYTPLSSFTLTCSLLRVRVWSARLMETLFDACLVALVALESISPGKGTYYGTLRCCRLPSKEKFPRQRPAPWFLQQIFLSPCSLRPLS